MWEEPESIPSPCNFQVARAMAEQSGECEANLIERLDSFAAKFEIGGVTTSDQLNYRRSWTLPQQKTVGLSAIGLQRRLQSPCCRHAWLVLSSAVLPAGRSQLPQFRWMEYRVLKKCSKGLYCREKGLCLRLGQFIQPSVQSFTGRDAVFSHVYFRLPSNPNKLEHFVKVCSPSPFTFLHFEKI